VLQVFAARRLLLGHTRATLLPGLVAVTLLLGGCGDLDAAASAQGIARNDLVSELATQLSGSATATYTAGYHLAGGGRATVVQAQNPSRTSFDYPGGRLLVSDHAVTQCRGGPRPTCTVTAPPAGGALPAETYNGAERTGLVTPATVLALLNAAALDAAVTVQQRDTTIASHHATCVDLTGVKHERSRSFSTCVTNDGVLGSFTGTLDGRPLDMVMTAYSAKHTTDAFDLPSGARVVPTR
jgi:hypothetical protein